MRLLSALPDLSITTTRTDGELVCINSIRSYVLANLSTNAPLLVIAPSTRIADELSDEIRSLEATELGLPHQQHVAAPKGRATEGQPGTRKMRYGKTQRKFGK